MTQPLASEQKADENKPRYEPPQIVDLAGMAQARGGEICAIGSGVDGPCATGIRASFSCSTGTSPNQNVR